MKYLKTYKIFESLISFPTSKEEIDKICLEYGIRNYTINDDFSIDVNGSVDIEHCNLEYLPIQFNKVSGNFYCSNNQLTSLEGCPKEVGGNFYCYYNNLTSLEGCPNEVGGNLYCYNNKLVNLYPLTKEPIMYGNNPCTELYQTFLKDLEIEFVELIFRLEEFNCFKGNKLDIINLENLYDFYNKDFDENNFK